MIQLWKNFQYLNLVGLSFLLVFSFLFRKNYFYSTYLSNIYLSFIVPVLFIYLSIMIVFGIRKKLKLGYYSSIAYLTLVLLISGNKLFRDFSVIDVFALVVFILIFYNIHKERAYFGIAK